MDADLWDRITAAWTEIAAAPAGFLFGKISITRSPGSRLCPPDWVGAIWLGDSAATAGALITAPDELQAARVRGELSLVAPARVTDLPSWDRLQPDDPKHVLGPASLAYLDGLDFKPYAGEPVVMVALADVSKAIIELQNAAGPDDVNEAGVTEATSPLFVIWRGDTVAAVCAYRVWVGVLAHMMVLTHPEHRRQGLAKRAATVATRHALDAGLIPQWRARVPASQAVARSLGYETAGAQLSLRLS
jgi:GNAT superfamily N-acetyltransferase